ncbi:MAG TPA: hypothetical protein VEL31_16985 [Ktedonobacteraceae bacterium]|nr:hypothetical protein [Ktedonobacteraceae bacterium]
MAFRVKNLMIQVLPEAGEKFQQMCGNRFSIGTTPFCVLAAELDAVSDPATLTTLKEQLQEALKAVEEQESVINEQNRVKTLEQAVELEKHLTSALEEVRLQKQALQNKPDGGQE